MKRGIRITLLTLLVILAVGLVVDGGMNAVLSRVVLRRVNKVLASLPECDASCGDIQVGLLSGTAKLKDLRFAYHNDSVARSANIPGSEMYVESIEVGHVFYSMLFNKEALVHSFSLIRPRIELWMDEDHPELCFPETEPDTTVKKLIFPLKRAELMNLYMEEVSVALHSTRSDLDVAVDECSLAVHSLAYDSVFSCDSAFRFSLKHAAVILPDGRTRVETKDIHFCNQEMLTIGATRFVNTLKNKGAGSPGADIRVDRIEVGPVSHSALLNKQLVLEAVTIVRPEVELWMDEEHPERSFQVKPKKKNVQPLTLPVTGAELHHFHISGASLALHSTRTKLDVEAGNCSLSMHRLVYNSDFRCDSLLSFSLGHVAVCFPDGRMRLETQDITRRDKEGFSIGRTHFAFPPVEKASGKTPGADIQAEHLTVGPVSFEKLYRKEVQLNTVSVERPRVELWMDEEHLEYCFRAKPEKKHNAKPASLPFTRAELQHLLVDNASLALHSTRTKLDVKVDSCSLALHHLGYDKTFRLCDSVYRFALEHAAVMLPDGLMRLETSHIEQTDAGALTIGATRIAHTMAKMKLGDIVKEPTTWIDMQIERVKTVPFNPIRKAFAKDFTLEQVDAVISRMDLLRDLRYKPTKPFIMPQQAITEIPVPFCIKQANAKINRMNIDLISTDINCGSLQFSNLQGAVENITNRANAVMKMKGLCPFEKGKALIQADMTMNDACSFTMDMQADKVDASFLNSLIRPLVGMTCELQIDSMNTRYTGNRYSAQGTFLLCYHGLQAKVHKEDDIPYKIVTKAATAINAAANTLLPKSNPPTPHARPKAYNIEWQRDSWSPTELYIFGPCIDGIKKTLLPGLFIKERVRDKDSRKRSK